MKILKPGSPPAEVLTGTCTECGCQVQAEMTDKELVYFTGLRLHPSFFGVYCPTEGCGKRYFVDNVSQVKRSVIRLDETSRP
jgi:hypothetical protein